MKTNKTIAAAAAILAMCASSASVHAQQSQDPSIPVGTLDAYPAFVQPGARPNLTWNITYPSVVEDYVDVDDDEVTPTTRLVADIRILGNGVTVGSGSNIEFVPAKAVVKCGNDSYTEVFYGTNDDVVPGEVVWSQIVNKGETMRFGGQYYWRNNWGHFYSSGDGTTNIRTLVNGDAPPKFNMVPGAPTLESFLEPYLDDSGRIKIGPMDVICFMELTHSESQSDSNGYDFQDMVLLVTFRVWDNNGHGNNEDGVDSSNPGNAPFAENDSDPNTDDEAGGGGAYPSQP